MQVYHHIWKPPLSSRSFTALTSAAGLLFGVYAASFLYFFVDDEAIPLVYARNLLRGRGLVYTTLEGRAEGYSDFLHVLWSAVVLQVTRVLHLPPLAPLLIGKGVSFIAALAIIVMTARWLRRIGVQTWGLAAALAFLALAGPLAVWACSSLETAIFACMVTGLAVALMDGRQTTAIVLGIALVFERLDGGLFVGALLVAALVSDFGRRRALWQIAWPVALAALAFHAWRFSFFGSLLSEPLAAKVLHRLSGSAQVVVKQSDAPYLLELLRLYGLAAAPVLVLAAILAWRVPAARMSAVALCLLGTYVGLVGDWMFGWRFTVALFPFAAVILAAAVSRASSTVGWCLAVVITVWSGSAALRFGEAYVASESKPIFWTQPRLGAAVWLAPYYDLIGAAAPLMHPGDRVAYNQAGLLPYLLDLENIDDLGICSRFVAHLPTTDVFYTGVGRYSALTDQPVLRTAHAYLLYQDVQFLVTPTDLLGKANHNMIPETLLNGFFRRVRLDASGANAIYTRTAKSAEPYRRDLGQFRENLTHTSRLTRGAINSTTIPFVALGPELPFLREQTRTFTSAGDLDILVSFGTHDADASALYVGHITSAAPGTLTLSLFDETGRTTLQRTIAIRAADASVLEEFAPVRAKTASFRFQSTRPNRITLTDMRLEGQSDALREYVRHALRPPSS